MRNYGRSSMDGSKNIYLSGNSRGDEIQAAFLTAKLSDLDAINKKRRKIIDLYTRLLSPIRQHISIPLPRGVCSSPGYWNHLIF